MAKIEFHFDFGSPNAYLAHLVVPEVEKRSGVEFDYVPILLGGVFKLTNNRSPVEKLAGIKNRLAYEQLEVRRFIRNHGITQFTWNPYFPVNTLLIMRGAVAAQMEGVFDRYVEAAFKAMWAEQKNMSDADVVATVLQQAGLDGARLIARTQEPEVKERLLKNTEASVARGAFGSPTFFVGDEIFFGKDKLRDVEDEIARAKA
jgi:2-hydroxychromene-2-carboxylate isomerase